MLRLSIAQGSLSCTWIIKNKQNDQVPIAKKDIKYEVVATFQMDQSHFNQSLSKNHMRASFLSRHFQ